MKILDRYIARTYLINILTLLVVLFCFVVSVDVIVNLGRFGNRADQIIEASDDPSRGALRRLMLMGVLVIDLWGPRLLQLFTYLNGMVLITAMGFTLAQLVRHRELVAILSSGVSLHRVARPFLGVAIVMIVTQAVVQERLIPPVAHLLTRDPGESGRREVDAFPVKLVPDAQGRLWQSPRYDDATATLERPRIWERQGSRLTRVITATAARWTPEGWELTNGRATTPAVASDGALAPPQRIDRLESDLDPQRLKVRYFQGFAQSLSWGELQGLEAQLPRDSSAAGSLDRVRWGRVAGWVSNLLALWAALPFFLVKAPRPLLGASLKAALVALGGFAATAIASSVSTPGLPVWLGAFVPSMVLLSIAVAVYTGLDT